jgi:uncharacterized protein YggE
MTTRLSLSASFLVALAAVLILSLPARGAAEAGAAEAGTVTGTGRAVLTRPATVLRVQIDVPASGKTVEEAMAQLKSKRAALAAKLKTLGAAEGAVKFGDPRLAGAGPAGNAQQRYVQQMMRMARGNRGGAKKPEAPAVVAVLLPVTAEWTIKAGGAEEAIVAGHKLRESVQKAGLSDKPEGGAAAKAEEAAEEQELAEEAAGMGDDEGGAGAAKPGEPRFTFVARVSDQDRAAASKEAFDKARAAAAQVAQAAGGKVGRLRSASARVGSAAGNEDDDPTTAIYAQYMQSMGMGGSESSTDAGEAAGAEPGLVSLKVTVSATFALE